jgi:extracellular factor (EF) 3-hydroxypalmitic acid methyl ester biosynthesis protein
VDRTVGGTGVVAVSTDSILAGAVQGFLDATTPGRIGTAFAALGAAIEHADVAGWPPDRIRAVIEPARRVYAESPFAAHAQTWPRGYPGDYEIVEDIIERRNRAEPGSRGWHLTEQTLALPMSQQHRNKVGYQARLIGDLLAAPGEGRRVLLIAAGTAPDLRRAPLGRLRRGDVIVLNDADPDALTAARGHLGPIASHCAWVGGNVLRALPGLAALGPYHLVVAGGLMDYLRTPVARRLLARLVLRLTRPGGTVYFSNLAAPHRYRWLTEHLLDWPLLARDETAVRALIAPVRHELTEIRLRRDPTDLVILATLKR